MHVCNDRLNTYATYVHSTFHFITFHISQHCITLHYNPCDTALHRTQQHHYISHYTALYSPEPCSPLLSPTALQPPPCSEQISPQSLQIRINGYQILLNPVYFTVSRLNLPALGSLCFQMFSSSVMLFAFKCFSLASERTVPFQFLSRNECYWNEYSSKEF